MTDVAGDAPQDADVAAVEQLAVEMQRAVWHQKDAQALLGRQRIDDFGSQGVQAFDEEDAVRLQLPGRADVKAAAARLEVECWR